MTKPYFNLVRNAVLIDQNMYLVPGNHHAIYRIDLATYKRYMEVELDEEPNEFPVEIYQLGDGVLCCVQILTKRMKIWIIERGNRIREYESDILVETIESFLYKDEILFIPRHTKDSLYCFSLKTHAFYVDLNWEKEVKRNGIIKRIQRTYKDKNNIYMVFPSQKRVMVYDTIMRRIWELEVPEKKAYFDVAKIDKTFYLIEEKNEGTVYEWDTNNDTFCQINSEEQGRYNKIIKCNNIIFLQGIDHMDVLINRKPKRILSDFIYEKTGRSNYYHILFFNEKFYFMPWGSEYILCCSSEYELLFKRKLLLDAKRILFSNEYIEEDKLLLDNYLNLVEEQ